ncbi:MAG: tail fiber domain-containing protein [Candidatus Omnitrophica bacterium]|nr:tail fiber domain-containing protein [Candidatus Omnitrophota bacterium]
MRTILLIALVLTIAGISYAQDQTEDITLTTYYPAPYGEYDTLNADTLNCGDITAEWIDIDDGTAATGIGGRSITIQAQDGGTGNTDGGDIILIPGTSSGTGKQGNVGIETTDPGYPLTVGPNSAGAAVHAYGDGTASTNFIFLVTDDSVLTNQLFRVQNDGNVGIGTTAPGSKLDVSGTANITGIVDIGSPSTSSTASGIDISGSPLRIGNNTTGPSLFIRQGGGSGLTNWVASLQNASGSGKGLSIRAGSGSAHELLEVADWSGTVRFAVYGSGVIKAPYIRSVGGGSALRIMGSGELIEATSSRRYKKNIRDLKVDSDKVFELNPVRFQWKETDEEDIGLIAEEVDESIKDLVIYDDKERPDGVKYEKVALYLLEAVKNQQSEIDNQQAKIEALSRQVRELLAEDKP